YCRLQSPTPLLVSSFCPTSDPCAISSLSLHDALPILFQWSSASQWLHQLARRKVSKCHRNWCLFQLSSASQWSLQLARRKVSKRSEEHTSELQSRFDLVCRLLLEKKKRSVHVIAAFST